MLDPMCGFSHTIVARWCERMLFKALRTWKNYASYCFAKVVLFYFVTALNKRMQAECPEFWHSAGNLGEGDVFTLQRVP